MKKLKIYKKYMIRAIVYKTISKCAIVLAIALIWNLTVNKSGFLSMVEHAFFILGGVLMLLAWFNYLSLDGMRLNFMKKNERKKSKKFQRHKDIVDFADEDVVSFDELSSDERVACKMASNLIAGAVFLVPALVVTLF